MPDGSCIILFEDNHCLAMDKPAGMLTMGDRTGDRTAVDSARGYLKSRYHKPGNVFVGVVQRLDRPVSGVLLFARTSKAASRLSEQFRRGSVSKLYHAVVHGRLRTPQGTLEHSIRKDRAGNRVSVVTAGSPGSRESCLRYRVLQANRQRSLVEIEPETGRSHQIRLQLATIGHPIVGDVKYGSTVKLGHRIALHAHRLEFQHPTQRQSVIVESSFPAELQTLFVE